MIDVLYTKPYSRVGVYLVGFWAAWYLSKIDRVLKINRMKIIAIWTLTLSITTFMVFIQILQQSSYVYGAIFPAFGRTVWSIALAMMVIACATENGGIITKILDSKIWLALSRISYSTFLLNPIVYLVVLFSCEVAMHLTVATSVNIIILQFLKYFKSMN